jgi:L-lactate dehydrogenase complex protein LldG
MAIRQEFLERVRREVRRTQGLFEAIPAPRPTRPGEAAATVRRELAERWPAALERFREEFERVGGVFHRATTAGAVPATVEAIAREHGARSAVTWGARELGVDVPAALRAPGLAVTAVPSAAGEAARHAHRSDAVAADVGVTGVDLALAETGTVILLSGPGRPRSTSLLPETHVAIFDRHRLVESLEQVGVILEALHAGTDAPDGAVINFITGPSRTADIELTLTRGVHGPKFIHAVFVEAEAGLGVPPPWGWP